MTLDTTQVPLAQPALEPLPTPLATTLVPPEQPALSPLNTLLATTLVPPAQTSPTVLLVTMSSPGSTISDTT